MPTCCGSARTTRFCPDCGRQLAEARELADAMDRWPNRKFPD